MVLLGDEAQVDARFWSVCRYYKSLPNIGAQFAPNIPQAQKMVWTHLMELLGDVGHMESCFDPFGDSASVGAR